MSSQIPAESWAPRVTRGVMRQVLVAQVQRSHRRQVQRVLETGCGQAGSRFMQNRLEFRFQLDASHPASRFQTGSRPLQAPRIALMVSVRLTGFGSG